MLPSVRALASEQGANPLTVAKAYQQFQRIQSLRAELLAGGSVALQGAGGGTALARLAAMEAALARLTGQTEALGKILDSDANLLEVTRPHAQRLLQRGETKGVFQLESGGMRDLLTKMKPTQFEDIIATSALYRPGPLEGGMVMEYVEGRDLAQILHDRGPLPLEEAVGYVVQTAQGLEYAHKRGIVHRDIKPANLLLDNEGTVKILDMGLARITAEAGAGDVPDQLTTSGQVMGTCDYMAPEQFVDAANVDHRADIYALGCTLYTLLTGQFVYPIKSQLKKALAHRDQPIPPLGAAREDVPPQLDLIYQKMLAKKASDWGFDGLEIACWGDHFHILQEMARVYAEMQRAVASAGLLLIAACGDDNNGAAEDISATAECDAEPVILNTDDGVDFVRTPDSCFENLPDFPYEAHYVEIDGLRQAYVDEGPADGEVVLLLHGQPSWSYLYRDMIPVFADAGYRVIAMDHLGMGRSDKPIDIEDYSYVGHADRLERFIEELDLTDINMFVQDWGSLIGLKVAGDNPDLFATIAVGAPTVASTPLYCAAMNFPPP